MFLISLSPHQTAEAWKQVEANFRECPTCKLIVCLSDWDSKSGYCTEDSPRQAEIAEAEGQQAGAAIKGFADAFGLGGFVKQAGELGVSPILTHIVLETAWERAMPAPRPFLLLPRCRAQKLPR